MERRDFLRAAAVAPLAIAGLAAGPATGVVDAGPGALGLTQLTDTRRPRRLKVLARGAWGGLPPGDGMRRHVPVRLTVHHQDVRIEGATEAPEQARQIQRFHMRELGHPDMDYHFLVDRRGFVYRGRSVRFVGDTQTEYDPTGHLLVCCLGDYQGESGRAQEPKRAMVRSLVLLLAWGSQRYDISPDTIGGHRDYADTTCPGRKLYRLIRTGRLQERVAALGRASSLELDALQGRRGRRLVRRIEQGNV